MRLLDSGTANINRIVTPKMIKFSTHFVMGRKNHDDIVELAARFFLASDKYAMHFSENESVLQCGVRGFSDFRGTMRDLKAISLYPEIKDSSWKDERKLSLRETSKYDPRGLYFSPFLVNFHGAEQISRLCAMASILMHALPTHEGSYLIESDLVQKHLTRVTEPFMRLLREEDQNWASPLRQKVTLPYNLGTSRMINLGESHIPKYDLIMAGDYMRSHSGETLRDIREIWNGLALHDRALLATQAQIDGMVHSGHYKGQWFLPDVSSTQRIAKYRGKGAVGKGFLTLVTCPEDSASSGFNLPELGPSGMYVSCDGDAHQFPHSMMIDACVRLVRLQKRESQSIRKNLPD